MLRWCCALRGLRALRALRALCGRGSQSGVGTSMPVAVRWPLGEALADSEYRRACLRMPSTTGLGDMRPDMLLGRAGAAFTKGLECSGNSAQYQRPGWERVASIEQKERSGRDSGSGRDRPWACVTLLNELTGSAESLR